MGLFAPLMILRPLPQMPSVEVESAIIVGNLRQSYRTTTNAANPSAQRCSRFVSDAVRILMGMLSYNASNVGMQAETCVLVAPARLDMTWTNFDIARGVSLTRSVLNAHYLLRQCSMSPSAVRVTSLRFGVENMSLWKVGRAGCVQHISEPCLSGAILPCRS